MAALPPPSLHSPSFSFIHLLSLLKLITREMERAKRETTTIIAYEIGITAQAKQASKKSILDHLKHGDHKNQRKLEELPLIDFKDLAVATDKFHDNQMLGQGGFGQVYKRLMGDGREIAVKRLSAASSQGVEEFTNKVIVISQLQHKNLVSLIGFCVEGEDKLLVYEYMPNKSLSAFLFDSTKQQILDWPTRFNIIERICRGLIYLHRDSRLSIIHRDLKASNILLDEELNPKIADFGIWQESLVMAKTKTKQEGLSAHMVIWRLSMQWMVTSQKSQMSTVLASYC